MKSKHLQNPRSIHRVGIGIAATLAAAVWFVAVTGGVADEPKSKPGAVPIVDKPFDAATMLSAENLVRDNPLRSSVWAAEISITTGSPDATDSSSLSGKLYNAEDSLYGKLRLAGDADHELYLLATKDRTVAWAAKDEQPKEGLLQRLVKGIYLIETLTRFPDQREAESKSVDDFEIANLGVSNQNGKRLYVIDAKPKEGASQSARVNSLGCERVTIKFSAENATPQQVSAIAANGSRWDLTFESIKTNVGDDFLEQVGEPPKGSLVIDLSGTSEVGGGLKNPVPYTADSIKRGKLLYIADCEVCHSVDGTGRDSDVTDNAADLTNTEFWLSDGSEAATFLAIRDGAGDEMPGYKDDYRDEKMIWDLVNYIRSLQK